MSSVFVIEHLDPKLWKWSLLEYAHISRIVGKESLLFTNTGSARLKPLGKASKQSIAELDVPRPCILDANAPETLVTADRDRFTHFIFGGVLGDDPPRGRTRQLLDRLPEASVRNLGSKQMSTDTAVLVTKRILDGERLSDIPFVDEVEIPRASGESVILPYRYVVQDGGPVLAPGLREMLMSQKGF